MGLDITAYKNVKLIETLESYEAFEDKYSWDSVFKFVSKSLLDMWSERNTDITPNGVYSYEDGYSLRAGSYSGYNYFRNELSKMMLNTEASYVWNEPERYKEQPFYELINFSDCEGVLGTQVCKNLLADFQQWSDIAQTHEDEWFVDKYNKWVEAFEYAAQNGFIDFH